MVKKYYLEKAKQEALKSQMNHKHGAIVVKNGKIISSGYNQYVEFCHTNRKISIHAEIDAIRNCYPKSKLKDSILYVVRIDRSRGLKFSKPCNNCIKYMENKTNLMGVYYSLSESSRNIGLGPTR